MPQFRTMVAMPPGRLRDRLVSTLRRHAEGEPEVFDDLEDLPGPGRQHGHVFFSPRGLTRESDPDVGLLMKLRLRWCVLLVFEEDTLLEAAPAFGAADGWIAADWLDSRVPDILALARERYAVLPALPDPRLGLDSLRISRFRELDEISRKVICTIARGDTNARAAQELRISQERTARILRRSLAHLGLERRTQAAAFMARTGLVAPPNSPATVPPEKG